MSSEMNINEIIKLLPHRYPFLLVDKVLSLDPGKSIVAIKNVTINEPFFPGHYPHYPVMPGVLIIEAMAQVAGLLSFKSKEGMLSEDSVYYFAGIDNARFKRPVTPGDQIVFKVEILRSARSIVKYKAVAEVDGKLAAEAEIMCAIGAPK